MKKIIIIVFLSINNLHLEEDSQVRGSQHRKNQEILSTLSHNTLVTADPIENRWRSSQFHSMSNISRASTQAEITVRRQIT